jgi:hypothetical protein
VDIAFKLEHEVFRQTVEVDDKSVQDVLATEFQTEHAPITE